MAKFTHKCFFYAGMDLRGVCCHLLFGSLQLSCKFWFLPESLPFVFSMLHHLHHMQHFATKCTPTLMHHLKCISSSTRYWLNSLIDLVLNNAYLISTKHASFNLGIYAISFQNAGINCRHCHITKMAWLALFLLYLIVSNHIRIKVICSLAWSKIPNGKASHLCHSRPRL